MTLLFLVILGCLIFTTPGKGGELTFCTTYRHSPTYALWGIMGIVLGVGATGGIVLSILNVTEVFVPWLFSAIYFSAWGYFIFFSASFIVDDRKKINLDWVPSTPSTRRDLLTKGFTTALMEGRMVLLFMAYFTQSVFISSTAILVTVCTMIAVIHGLYVLLAPLLKKTFIKNPSFKPFNCVTYFSCLGLVICLLDK